MFFSHSTLCHIATTCLRESGRNQSYDINTCNATQSSRGKGVLGCLQSREENQPAGHGHWQNSTIIPRTKLPKTSNLCSSPWSQQEGWVCWAQTLFLGLFLDLEKSWHWIYNYIDLEELKFREIWLKKVGYQFLLLLKLLPLSCSWLPTTHCISRYSHLFCPSLPSLPNA